MLTPDDVMDGAALPRGTRVVVWDDDHYYMASLMAEVLVDMGCETHYLTPACEVSTWTRATMEQHFIHARLLDKGVKVHAFANLDAVAVGGVAASCAITGRTEEVEADAVVLVTSREPEDLLARDLEARAADWRGRASSRWTRSATRSPRRPSPTRCTRGAATPRELDGPAVTGDEVPFKREIVALHPAG